MSDTFLTSPLWAQLLVLGMGVLSVSVLVGVPVWMVLSARRVTRDIHAFAAAMPTVAAVQPPSSFGRRRYPELKGHVEGVPIHIAVYDGGRYSRERVEYRAICSARLPDGLELRSQGVESRIGAMFGAQDIEVGDPAFDAAFVIKGTDEQAVRAFLADPRLRWELQQRLGGGIALSNGVVFWSVRGHQTDATTLRQRITRLVEVAQVVNRAGAVAAAHAAPVVTNKWRAYDSTPGWLSPLVVVAAFASPVVFVGLFYVPYVILPAALGIAYLVRRAWPEKPMVELTSDALVLSKRGVRHELPLRHLMWAYGPWSTPHHPQAGTLLYLQSGEQRWTLGGFGHHRPSYQVGAGAEADLTLEERAFGELVQALHQQVAALRSCGTAPEHQTRA